MLRRCIRIAAAMGCRRSWHRARRLRSGHPMVLCRGNRLAVHSGDGAAFDDEHLQVRVQSNKNGESFARSCPSCHQRFRTQCTWETRWTRYGATQGRSRPGNARNSARDGQHRLPRDQGRHRGSARTWPRKSAVPMSGRCRAVDPHAPIRVWPDPLEGPSHLDRADGRERHRRRGRRRRWPRRDRRGRYWPCWLGEPPSRCDHATDCRRRHLDR